LLPRDAGSVDRPDRLGASAPLREESLAGLWQWFYIGPELETRVFALLGSMESEPVRE
jgi:hypothetical protein